ncbi:MAG: DJ-1/PfpI family protein [Patescibacteria group bacterium]
MKKLLLLIILAITLSACLINKNISQPNNNMLKSKKILMVIAPKDFRDQEYLDPRKVFDKNGLEVKVASIQRGRSVGAEGTEVNIDLTISQVNENDFDAVVFIGGPGMLAIIDDDSLQILAKKFYQAGKLTTAICVAPAILAKAGIINGKKATAWSGSQADLEAGGAIITNEPVTIDENIITASGPAAAHDFAEKIISALEN